MKDLNSTTPMCVVNVAAEKASTSNTVTEECRGDKPCYFALLDLQPHFDIDLNELATRYRQRAALVHPDRFISAGEREKRLALEQSANLNEAYHILKSSSARARYLLTLKGKNIPLETTIQDPEFLTQQMMWHEELDELSEQPNDRALAQFKAQIKAQQQILEKNFADDWLTAENELAEKLVRRMQFMDKLLASIKSLEEHLDD